MRLNAFTRQPVSEIPRVSLARHVTLMRDALPKGTARAHRSRPILGGPFTDAEIALDYTAHKSPDTVWPEQLHSAVVYAARNEPDRIPLGWMRTLIHEVRGACAERLDLYDVDCHRCKRSVFVVETSDPCPSCGLEHSLNDAQMLDRALDTLRASGMVRQS